MWIEAQGEMKGVEHVGVIRRRMRSMFSFGLEQHGQRILELRSFWR